MLYIVTFAMFIKIRCFCDFEFDGVVFSDIDDMPELVEPASSDSSGSDEDLDSDDGNSSNQDVVCFCLQV